MLSRFFLTVAVALATLLPQPAAAQTSYTLFESDPVRPLALSPDGSVLFVCNIPDGRLEVFDLTPTGPVLRDSVPVGLEPVAVAARSASEAWVVNHLSDSVSIVDCSDECRVVRTLLVGDEPRDIVFAGAGGNRAFITAAHRGQSYPGDPQLEKPDQGRADTWVFDALDPGSSLGGDPITILSFFGDTTRALAASADGASVYSAVFRSGNQTTVVPGDVDDPETPDLICPGGEQAGPCEVVAPGSGLIAPGGQPGPNENVEAVAAPHTSLIVRFNDQSGVYEDELGRDWSTVIPYSLPDCDVAHIDADADPPAFVNDCVARVGTVLFAMAVNPVSGNLYVANTEAHNEIRFEPEVQGHLHEARITIVTPAYAVSPRHLNKHIDYQTSPAPPATNAASLATPTAVAVSGDGMRLYVAAFGSQKIGVFQIDQLENDTFVPSSSAHFSLSAGGPSGVVLDEARGRLYTLTRFDNSLRSVDLIGGAETSVIPLHNPEPDEIKAGRKFFYDAAYTSSNGEASCSSCHVFGHLDGLAWDLGNPDATVLANPLPQVDPAEDPGLPFHPMKGPLLTQTLRGLANAGPMHWRGDRFDPVDVFDETGAFKAFNPAFVSLLGRQQALSDPEMQAFTDFVLRLLPGPNPIRNLDGSLTPTQDIGRDAYFNFAPPGGKGTCVSCHELDPSAGVFGTLGFSKSRIQNLKVPSLRMMYEKVGYPGYESLNTCGAACSVEPAIRGFGGNSDGTAPTSFDPLDPGARLGSFVLAYPNDLTEVVGQQVTISDPADTIALDRLDLLLTRADDGACEVTASGRFLEERRSWLYDPDTLLFEADRAGETQTYAALLGSASVGSELTFTCVPPGSGERSALDRDEDGWYDRDELDVGTDPADATSVPGVCGNGVSEAGEDCDAPDLGAQTCQSLGYYGGALTCTPACQLDTQACTTLDGPFVAKFVKATGLIKPPGAQKLAIRSNGLDVSAAVFDVPADAVSVTVWKDGVKAFEAAVAAGDPDWKVKPTRWRWSARTAPHPAGLRSITLSMRSGELGIKVKAADTVLEDLTGSTVLDVALTIGDDSWAGPSPACSTSSNGSTLKCR